MSGVKVCGRSQSALDAGVHDLHGGTLRQETIASADQFLVAGFLLRHQRSQKQDRNIAKRWVRTQFAGEFETILAWHLHSEEEKRRLKLLRGPEPFRGDVLDADFVPATFLQ